MFLSLKCSKWTKGSIDKCTLCVACIEIKSIQNLLQLIFLIEKNIQNNLFIDDLFNWFHLPQAIIEVMAVFYTNALVDFCTVTEDREYVNDLFV